MLGKLVPFVLVGYVQMTVVLTLGMLIYRIPTVGSFALLNQTTLAPGDILELDAPNPADSTFAGPSYTIAGTR